MNDAIVNPPGDRAERRPSLEQATAATATSGRDREPGQTEDIPSDLDRSSTGADAARPFAVAGSGPGGQTAARDRLGDYHLLREIGRGGMGVVYEAEQVSLGRKVALKVLAPQVLRDPQYKRRFEREARAAARLHHTNIVPVFGIGEQDGTPYYVMQFIQGQGLDSVLEQIKQLRLGTNPGHGRHEDTAALDPAQGRRNDGTPTALAHALWTGRFTLSMLETYKPDAGWSLSDTDGGPADATEAASAQGTSPPPGAGPAEGISPAPGDAPALRLPSPGVPFQTVSRRDAYWLGVAHIGVQAADALAYAHAHGIVHRDIKPANLLLDTRGTVWVTDFGLAKADDQENLTHTGDMLGTLRFIPPEAFAGRADARGDIYSLGLTLYEFVACRSAFDETDRARLIKQVTDSQPPRLGKLNPAVPRDLETIIHKAIERRPDDRYASAAALATDLQRFLADQPILARRASLVERFGRWARHHPGIAILGAALTAVLLIATAASIVAASQFRAQARRQAEIAAEREMEHQRAEAAFIHAQAAQRKAETVVVDMHASHGLIAAERKDAARAMLWFARAAELAQHDADRVRLNRIRARTWGREAVLPVQAIEHGGQNVAQAVFHPAGKLLLTVDEGKRAHVWKLDDGAEVALPPALASSAAWSPDGTRLALGLESVVRLYRVADWSVERDLAGRGPITAIAFRRDGDLLAVGGADVRVWDVQTGRPIGPVLVHPGPVQSLEFNKRGDGLLTGCADGSTRVFDVPATADRPRFIIQSQSGEPEYAPRFSAGGDSVLCLTGPRELTWLDARDGRLTGPGKVALDLLSAQRIDVSPDGRWFAVAGYYGPLVFSVDRAGRPPRMLEHGNQVNACRFSSDSKLLLSASWDHTVKLWSIPDGELIGAPLFHDHGLSGAEFAPDGRHIATWQVGGLVRVWRLPERERARPVPAELRFGIYLRRSRDGRWAILGRYHNPYAEKNLGKVPLWVYDLATGKPTGTAARLPDVIHDAALDARGTRAAAVTQGPGGSFVHLWDVATGRPAFAPVRLTGRAIGVDFSPDDRLVATLSSTGDVSVFRVTDGHREADFVSKAAGQSTLGKIRFATAETLVALHSDHLLIFDMRAMRQRPEPGDVLCGQPWPSAMALSNDGRYAAVGASGDSRSLVRVWDLQTGAASSPILPHSDHPYALAFTEDDRWLLTGGADGQLRCWDWAAGTLAAPLGQAGDEIFEIAVLPGSRFAATAVRKPGRQPNGKLDLWDIASGQRVAPSLWLGNESVCCVTVSADGRHALAGVAGDKLYFVDLSDLVDPDERPTEELVRLGELASGQQIRDGHLAGLTTEEWLERWHTAAHRLRDSAGRPLTTTPRSRAVGPQVSRDQTR